MELPLDILDYIFNLLNAHPESLLAISNAHPVFSQLVERHRYRHITIHASMAGFHSSSLVKLLADNPRIASHVRVLEIELIYTPNPKEISSILPIFPALECILLPYSHYDVLWQSLPDAFTTAVEDYLHLPTIQAVHIGHIGFPLSVLDNHTNITSLSLSKSPEMSDRPDILYPQLKALSVKGLDGCRLFVDWAKRHISQLQSLNYESSDYIAANETILLGLLAICSDTLTNLDLGLRYNPLSNSLNGIELPNKFIDLSSLPLLQNMTLRVYEYEFWGYHHSSLPAACEILQTASSLRRLTLEIHLIQTLFVSIDFSPLEAWAKSSTSFNQIDLYISSDESVTHTEFISALERYGCLTRLIKQGVVVIHIGNAPLYLDMQSHYIP